MLRRAQTRRQWIERDRMVFDLGRIFVGSIGRLLINTADTSNRSSCTCNDVSVSARSTLNCFGRSFSMTPACQDFAWCGGGRIGLPARSEPAAGSALMDGP